MISALTVLALLLLTARYAAAEAPWVPVPPAQWKGTLDAQVPALKRGAAAQS